MLIQSLKQQEQDFEFYPTTDEIIAAVRNHERTTRLGSSRFTVADPCAGDGRFLMAFKGSYTTLAAYEKSALLRSRQPASVTFAGVDYMTSSLSEVRPSTVVCNPPYSEYALWVNKVLNEVNRGVLCYFVIPARWREEETLQHLFDAKMHEWESVGFFDFSEAERRARVEVEVLAVSAYAKDRTVGDELDRFFKSLKFHDTKEEDAVVEEFTGVAARDNIIVRHVSAYERRMQCLRQAIIDVSKIPSDVRLALELGVDRVKTVVRNKMQSTRTEAWDALFAEAEELNKRLTSHSTREIRRSMEAAGLVAFNTENVGAVVLRIIESANEFVDAQLIRLFESMAEYANVVNYKSNHKVYVRDKMRYFGDQEKPEHVQLGHRLVLERCGGLEVCPYSKPRKSSGLSGQAATYLRDLFAVAYTLGFQVCKEIPDDIQLQLPSMWDKWEDNSAQFYCKKNGRGKVMKFAHVRVFMNGNMHLKLLPEFVHLLSAKHGVLKGWLRNDPADIVSELNVDVKEAEAICGVEYRIGASRALSLWG